MRNYKIFFSMLLLAVCFLLPVSAEKAYAKEVKHNFGSIELPDEAYVIEVDYSSNNFANLPERTRRDMEKIARLLNMYQVTINDGESYRTALAVALLLDNELLREGRENLTEEQKERLSFRYGDWQKDDVARGQEMARTYFDRWVYEGQREIVPKMSKMQKLSFEDPNNIYRSVPSGLIDYEWSGIDTLKINGEYGYKSSGRFTGLLLGLMGSLNFDCYTYNIPGKGVGVLVFVYVDSERDYWKPIFERTVQQNSLL